MEEDNEYGGGPEAMEPEPEPEQQQQQHEQGPGGGGGETCANFYACFYMI